MINFLQYIIVTRKKELPVNMYWFQLAIPKFHICGLEAQRFRLFSIETFYSAATVGFIIILMATWTRFL